MVWDTDFQLLRVLFQVFEIWLKTESLRVKVAWCGASEFIEIKLLKIEISDFIFQNDGTTRAQRFRNFGGSAEKERWKNGDSD